MSPTVTSLLNSLSDIPLALWCGLSVLGAGTVTFIVARIREGVFGAIGRRLRRTQYMDKNTLAAQIEINNRLTDLQHRFKALRACVFQFHNGEYFMLANHSWKVTCTHEIPGPGIGMILGNTLRHFPATLLLDWVDPLFDPTSERLPRGVSLVSTCKAPEAALCQYGRDGFRILHYDTAQMGVSTGRMILNTHGICHAFTVPLFNAQNKNVIGALSVQFGELFEDSVSLNECELCVMCKVAEEIQYFLTTDYANYRKQLPLLLRWILPEGK